MRIFLCGFEKIPFYGAHFVAAEVSQIQTMAALRQILIIGSDEKLVVFKCDYLTPEHISFAQGIVDQYCTRVVYWVDQSAEVCRSVSLSIGTSISIYSQSQDLKDCLHHLLKNRVKPRRGPRTALRAKVIVKNSTYSELNNRLGQVVKVILDGYFEDFSQMGAKIKLNSNPFNEKEFICLMYQDLNGCWVEVESQIRWVKELAAGSLLGLQFVARTL